MLLTLSSIRDRLSALTFASHALPTDQSPRRAIMHQYANGHDGHKWLKEHNNQMDKAQVNSSKGERGKEDSRVGSLLTWESLR